MRRQGKRSFWIIILLPSLLLAAKYREIPPPRKVLQTLKDVPDEYLDDVVIPRVLYKTGPTETCEKSKPLQELFRQNENTSGYKILFFNDKESRGIFEKYFAPVYVRAYDMLKPPTFKADLFRIAILYLCGGVYGDLLQEFLINPQESIDHLEDECTFVYIQQDPIKKTPKVDGIIHNAFIAAPPRHPLFRFILDRMVSDILRRRIPEITMGVTGPRACSEHYNAFFHQHPHHPLPQVGTKQVLRGIDGKEHTIHVPFIMVVNQSMEYMLDAAGQRVIKRNRYPQHPLYARLFGHRKHYSQYSVHGIYNK